MTKEKKARISNDITQAELKKLKIKAAKDDSKPKYILEEVVSKFIAKIN